MNTILKGSDTAFQAATQEFLQQVEDHVKVSLAQMFSPREVLCRATEINTQLSQNVPVPGSATKRMEVMQKAITSSVHKVADELAGRL